MAEDAGRVQMKAREQKCIEYLVAMDSRLSQCGDAMRERLRRIPNGWRQWRLIATSLERLLPEILDTMPMKSLQYLYNISQHGEVLIRYRPVSRAPEWKMVKDEDLEVLVNTAMASECAMCLRQGAEVKKCALRRALCDMAPVDEDFDVPSGCGYRDYVLQDIEDGRYVRRDGT